MFKNLNLNLSKLNFNLLKIWKYLPLLSLIDDVVGFIKQAQTTITGPGANDEKLKLVSEQFVALIKEAQDADAIPANVAEAIESAAPAFVSLIVQVMKWTGSLHAPGATPTAATSYNVWTFGTAPTREVAKNAGYQEGDIVWTTDTTQPVKPWLVTRSGQPGPSLTPDGSNPTILYTV